LNGADETLDLTYGDSATLNLDANASDASVGSSETLNASNSNITVNGDGADLTITGGGSTVTAGNDITALISANYTHLQRRQRRHGDVRCQWDREPDRGWRQRSELRR
jgi:hypothetical protein